MNIQVGFKKKIKKAARLNVIAVLVLALSFTSVIFTVNAPNVSADTSAQYDALVLMSTYDTTDFADAKQKAVNRVNTLIAAGTLDPDNVDVMTFTEFNARTFDIQTEYDYILVVLNDSVVHVGNDLNAMVTGLYTNAEWANLDSQPYAATHYYYLRDAEEGNDLTVRGKTKLKEYYDANLPLEFSVIGTPEDTMGNAIVGDPDETNVGHLFDEVGGTNLLFTVSGNPNVNAKLQNVKHEKLSIVMTSQPTDYRSGFANQATSVTKTLVYRFKIEDTLNSGSMYTVHLYTDDNYDGYYNKATEAMKDMGIVLASNRRVSVDPDKLQAGIEYKMTINASDYVGIFEWQLYVQENTSTRYTHADGTAKLQRSAAQPDKEKIRVLQIGDVYVQSNYLPTEEEKKWMDSRSDLTVANFKDKYLSDFNPNNYTPGISATPGIHKVVDAVKHSTSWDSTYGYNQGQITTIYLYYEYMKQVDDYDITTKRVTAPDLVSLAGGNTTKQLYDYMNKNFDMVIIGFNNEYYYWDLNDVFDAVIDFAEIAGKSVLMTHDTSGFYFPESHYAPLDMASERTSMKLRDFMGMDRFGYAAKYLYTGSELVQRMQGKDYNNIRYELQPGSYGQEHYATFYQPQGTVVNVAGSATVPYWKVPALTSDPGFTTIGAINQTQKPTRYVSDYTFNSGTPKSAIPTDARNLVAQWSAGSDPTPLKVYNITGFKKFYKGNMIPDRSMSDFLLNQGSGAKTGYQDTHLVEQVNVGAITTYPFELGNTSLGDGTVNQPGSQIKIASSHHQWFKLNLNQDEITVWYTMLNDGLTGGLYSPIYMDNPRDGANNYYIFSKGNVYYSGVGHESVYEFGVPYYDEVQLFINTFVASYRSANRGIQFVCNNLGADQDYNGNYTLNVDYLKDINDSTTNGAIGSDIVVNGSDRYKRVDFAINDNTVGNNKTMTVDFYKVSAIPTPGTDVTGSALTYFQDSIYEAGTGKVVAHNELYPGESYYIYIPIDSIGEKEIIQNMITMRYTSSGTGEQYVKQYYQYVTINNQHWFNLD